MDITFFLKLVVIGLVSLAFLVIIMVWFKRKGARFDYRLLLGYFIFAAWFGMYGEMAIIRIGEWIFGIKLWEYRILPIQNGSTSLYGPIMWGMAGVLVGLIHHYAPWKFTKQNKYKSMIFEAVILMVMETVFNLMSIYLFGDYFYYYYVPDVWHLTSFTNIPFWIYGYSAIVTAVSRLYGYEKFSFKLALIMLVVAIGSA